MFLIAGLGNPGLKYAATRHNIGFDMITYLCDKYDISLRGKEGNALTGKGFISGEKVLLAQPQTYMNESGISIRALKDFYKLSDEDIIIICDDINLDLGRIRIRPKGSAGGHNGLKSIISHLGTDAFARIRIGVGENMGNLVDYVLGRFSRDEERYIRDIFELAEEGVLAAVNEGVESAMNKVNGKRIETGEE